MARYLVTGGCGFIGSHLVGRLVADGHDVIVLDDLSTGRRENIPDTARILLGDVADAGAVAELCRDIDGCFHLAAVASVEQSILRWRETHAINLGGLLSVLDGIRKSGRASIVPVVYASSAAVYGDNPDRPLAESSAPRPLSAYGADKYGCELHARVGALAHGIRSVGFRFFNVFGPRQDPRSPYSGVISIFARRILDGRTITIFGDGEQTRDFIFVADVIDHLMAGMSHPGDGAEVFNVCTGVATSVNALARSIGEAAGMVAEIRYAEPRGGDIRHSLGAPDRALARFGLTRRIALSEGLESTIAWMRETS